MLFVRILQNQGGGKYLASFAGGRFLVKSDVALKAGETFHAHVKVANGNVFLLPQNGEARILGANAISVHNFNFQSPEASAFLASFGLPADGVSQKILQFLMQSGARLDAALMKKARRLAAKFTGREIDAAESAILLEQNGFDSEDFLEEIMELLDGGFQEKESENSHGGNENPRRENSNENSAEEKSDEDLNVKKSNENSGDGNSDKNSGEKNNRDFENDLSDGAISKSATLQDEPELENESEFFLRQCAEEIKRFFSFALGGDFQGGEKNDSILQDSILQKSDFQKNGNPREEKITEKKILRKSDFQNSNFSATKVGTTKFGASDFFHGEKLGKNFLAFFNQTALKSQGKETWIFLPFEFEMNSIRKNGDAVRGAGVFRICLDLEKNLAEKIAMNFKFAGKNVRFVIYFEDKKVCRVHFSFEGFEEEAAARNLARIFGEGVEVREISSEEFSSYGTEDLPLPSVEGFA